MMKNLDPISGAASLTLKKLCPKPVEELGELLADRVRFIRYKNQVAILEEAKRFSERKGIELSPLTLKTLVPLLDAASLEEDSDLQKLWARLLVNAGSINSPQYAQNLAIDFLKSISGRETEICEAAIRYLLQINEDPKSVYIDVMLHLTASNLRIKPCSSVSVFQWNLHISEGSLLERVDLDQDSFAMSMDNLLRFRVLESVLMENADGIFTDKVYYCFTSLGWEMVRLFTSQAIPKEQKNSEAK